MCAEADRKGEERPEKPKRPRRPKHCKYCNMTLKEGGHKTYSWYIFCPKEAYDQFKIAKDAEMLLKPEGKRAAKSKSNAIAGNKMMKEKPALPTQKKDEEKKRERRKEEETSITNA